LRLIIKSKTQFLPMNQNYTDVYLFTVDENGSSIINVNEFLTKIDKELEEILGSKELNLEPKNETVNAILSYCK